MTVQEIANIQRRLQADRAKLAAAGADRDVTAGIRSSMANAFAARRTMEAALGRSTMLETIERYSKLATGDLVSGAFKPYAGIVDQSGAAARLVGKGAFAKANVSLATQVFDTASIKVNAEPLSSMATQMTRGGFAQIASPATDGLKAQFADLGFAGVAPRSAFAEMSGLADQIIGRGSGADLARINRMAVRGIAPRITGKALGFDMKRAFPSIAGLGDPALVKQRVDQLMPVSVRDFMRSSLWPASVIRGFDRVRRAWERRVALEEELDGTQAARLLFMLDHIGEGRALIVMEQLAVDGVDPLLDLLEGALVAPTPIAVMRECVEHSPHLRESVRRDLRRGLDHLEEDDYDAALPSLMWGLEGAFRDGAKARGTRKKIPNAQSAIVRIGLAQERELFLRQAIYSSEGNDARHGEDADRRAFSLLTLVGYLCWFEEFTGERAIEWLGHRLDSKIRHATQQLALV